MRCCAKALVALDRTRTYRSERSNLGRSHTDKRMLDHADPTDLSGQRDLDCASCTNLTGLMCVQEPCTSSRWRSVKGSRSSKARVLLCDLHVLVRTFYHITWLVRPDGRTYWLPKHTFLNSFNNADFVTAMSGALTSPCTAENENLRASFTQEKAGHAGNRTHAYHAQKRMWFSQQASIILRMGHIPVCIFPAWVCEPLWLWTWSLGNRS